MTIRGLIKVSMSLFGALLLLALLNSKATFEAYAGWYTIGIIMALAGAIPDWMSYSSATAGILVLCHELFTGGEGLYGVGWPHALFCISLAFLFHQLALASVTRMLKCPHCFWHGPATKAHFNRCPSCGSQKLKDNNRNIMVHS